jgi:hypothetical protein
VLVVQLPEVAILLFTDIHRPNPITPVVPAHGHPTRNPEEIVIRAGASLGPGPGPGHINTHIQGFLRIPPEPVSAANIHRS